MNTYNVLLRVLRYTLRLRFICICLISLLPKRKSVWVFGAWFGKSFSDNPKYMYQYVSSLSDSDILPVWITKDVLLAESLKKQGVNAYHHKSLLGIYYQAIAKVALVSHSIGSDLNPAFIGYNTIRVMLWHGVGLKKVGYDDKRANDKNKVLFRFPRLLPFLINERYDMVISTGELCSASFSTAFNIPLERIKATGFPRNDVFLKEGKSKEINSLYKVIYMPTFRGGAGEQFDLFESFGFDASTVESTLSKNNIELWIRTHPVNKPSSAFLENIKDSQRIKISTVSDIYEEIDDYDCLITDYSSIMFDFSISKKPILFAPFDLERYLKKDREHYFPYSSVASSESSSESWPSLMDKIVESKSNTKEFVALNENVLSFHDDILLNGKLFSSNVYNAVKALVK